MVEYSANSRRGFIKKMGAASLAAASVSIPATSFLSSVLPQRLIPRLIQLFYFGWQED